MRPGIASDGARTDPPQLLPARAGGVAQRALQVSQGRVRSVAAGPAGVLLILRRTEIALAGQARSVPRRLVRVPLSAIVEWRSTEPAMLPPPATARLRLPAPASRTGTGAGAPTPDAPRARRTGAAYLIREAAVLALFAATLAATYYLGRTNAFQNVIIVPEPWSTTSRLS